MILFKLRVGKVIFAQTIDDLCIITPKKIIVKGFPLDEIFLIVIKLEFPININLKIIVEGNNYKEIISNRVLINC